MFGRVRSASSSTDSLESHASKLLKQDSLSIYEATLLKLKLGSQHDHIKQVEAEASSFSQQNDAFKQRSSLDRMALDSNSHPNEDLVINFSSRASDYNTSTDSKQQRGGNMSVVDLFSRYKTSMLKSTQNETMKMENEDSSSNISSTSSQFLSQCPPLGSMDLHLESEMECVG